MSPLGLTIDNLSSYRRQWEAMLAAPPETSASPGPLTERTQFGSNPGNLRMLTYVPGGLRPQAPLVVVLHGCRQTAAEYNRGSGWSTLADRHGFALLYPEQLHSNNANGCFSWFHTKKASRDHGEAASIRQMVASMIRWYRLDVRRVFITGLSAGGAMTSAMLANYPEVFAGGAIIAGLPYGAATNLHEAMGAMFLGHPKPAREWGDLVRAASLDPGNQTRRDTARDHWPIVSVWHGGRDTTVQPLNQTEIIKQWTDIHQIPAIPTLEETGEGYTRHIWCDKTGRAVLESFRVAELGHGVPLQVKPDGTEPLGEAGPYMLDVGISSTEHIAAFWGLLRPTTRWIEPPRLSSILPFTRITTPDASPRLSFARKLLRKLGLTEP